MGQKCIGNIQNYNLKEEIIYEDKFKELYEQNQEDTQRKAQEPAENVIESAKKETTDVYLGNCIKSPRKPKFLNQDSQTSKQTSTKKKT